MQAEEQKLAKIRRNLVLYIVVWLLIVLNGGLIYRLSFGGSWASTLFFLIMAVVVPLFLIMYVRSDKANSNIPESVVRVVQETMEFVKPTCEEIISQEIEKKVRPVLETAENQFREGLSTLWQSGERLRDTLYEGLLKGRDSFKEAVAFFHYEDLIKIQPKIELKYTSLVEELGKIDEDRERDEQELAMISQRLILETENRLDREKQVMFDYLQHLLEVQLSEEYNRSGELLVPNVEKITQQFHLFVESNLDNKLELIEKRIAEKLEDLAAEVVGEIQSRILTQINGIDKLIDYKERALGGPRKSPELVKMMNVSLQILIEAREEANNVLMSLAWHDLMVEKRWQEVTERINSMQEMIAKEFDREAVNQVKEELLQEVPGFAELADDHRFRSVGRELILAELVFKTLEAGSPIPLENEAQALFQYAMALERMTGIRISMSTDELKQCRHLKERIKDRSLDHIFQAVKDEITARKPHLLEYLSGVYPQQLLNFCSNPYLRSKPVNCGQAGWMLFSSLGETQENPEANADQLFLIGLLLVVQVLRNQFIHPIQGVQMPRDNDMTWLDDMRSAALAAFDLLTGGKNANY